MEKIYDVVIIGGGPGGMTAGIYASRAQLDYVLLEKSFAGGQMTKTYDIENYTGYNSISGIDLAQKMQAHLEYLGGKITFADVIEIKIGADNIKEVVTDSGSYFTKNIVVATGATQKKLGIPGEEEFAGRGLSYCATCDGAFYKELKAIVVGGGDVAVEDAIYLSRICKKVYIAHRRDEFRAVKNLQTKLFAIPNIEVLWFTEAQEIKGENFVTSISLIQNQTKETFELEVDGVFIAVGSTPNTEFLGDLVEKDSQGAIMTNDKCQSSVEGIYAIGDIRNGSVRQIMAACSDGVVAIMDIDKRV